jgi:hypothetical protein
MGFDAAGKTPVCDPKRFQAKWIPVRVKKTRQNKKIERSDSYRNALESDFR